MADIPVLDSPRTVSNEELGRIVLAEHRALHRYVEEMDWCCTLPAFRT
jgi:hypothetical protein